MFRMRQSADALSGLNAVDSRHLPIDEGHVVGLIPIKSLFYEFNTFLAGRRLMNVKRHVEQHAGKDFARLRIVVDDEHTAPLKLGTREARGHTVTLAKIRGKPEGTAFSDFAGHADVATH